MSYSLGPRAKTVLPRNYDPLSEMTFLSRVVLAVFKVPGVICYFNPNGEVLYDRDGFCEVWDGCLCKEKIPLPLWMNIRFFNPSLDRGVMDTVGNQQLGIRDVEALFSQAEFEPREIDDYLRRLTRDLLDRREFRSGEAIDGPGKYDMPWIVDVCKGSALNPPARPVVRLYPEALLDVYLAERSAGEAN